VHQGSQNSEEGRDGRMSGPDETSIVEILGTLYRRRALVGAITGIGLSLGIIVPVVLPRVYVAQTIVVPTSELSSSSDLSSLSQLRGAAATLGLGMVGQGTSITPLLPDLLSSRDLLRGILAKQYPLKDGTSVDLIHYLKINESDPDRTLQKAVIRLRKVMTCTTDKKSGTTTIAVALKDPTLAAAVANEGVAELEIFVRDLKTSQAGQKVRFISQRLTEVEAQLRQAEDSLRSSKERNRLTVGSPLLMLEQARLARDVSMNEQVFITLKTQLEIAQVEAVRDVPDLAVVEKAVPPVYESNWLRVLVGSTFFAGFIGMAVALSLPYLDEFKRVMGRGGPTEA
jgi:uncharacterized protein involved in exopolysaccharide biosynthesis